MLSFKFLLAFLITSGSVVFISSNTNVIRWSLFFLLLVIISSNVDVTKNPDLVPVSYSNVLLNDSTSNDDHIPVELEKTSNISKIPMSLT